MSTAEGKGQQEETIEIKKSIVIDASPEVVFKAITDPNELTTGFQTMPYLMVGSEEKSDSPSIKKNQKS
jgi:uncharacterized protein YndB with AHSA1/START domain